MNILLIFLYIAFYELFSWRRKLLTVQRKQIVLTLLIRAMHHPHSGTRMHEIPRIPQCHTRRLPTIGISPAVRTWYAGREAGGLIDKAACIIYHHSLIPCRLEAANGGGSGFVVKSLLLKHASFFRRKEGLELLQRLHLGDVSRTSPAYATSYTLISIT